MHMPLPITKILLIHHNFQNYNYEHVHFICNAFIHVPLFLVVIINEGVIEVFRGGDV